MRVRVRLLVLRRGEFSRDVAKDSTPLDTSFGLSGLRRAVAERIRPSFWKSYCVEAIIRTAVVRRKPPLARQKIDG